MTTNLHIDFVSDIACPWCAVGLASLDVALKRLSPDIQAEIHFQPFELNPHMGPEGQDMTEHLTQKYGSSPEQQAQSRDVIRQRGAAAGFEFKPEGRGRIWNTFDAHRLTHWAGTLSLEAQHALKMELLKAYHGRAEKVSDPAVLVQAASAAGLDAVKAQEVVESDQYALEVRSSQQEWQRAGIRSVPAVVVNRKYLISGGQPAEAFEEALRNMAQELSNQEET
jgi:predicted DsbA family dithiol-disulfide isomerase